MELVLPKNIVGAGFETWDDYLPRRSSRIERVFLVLPAFNEEESLPNLLDRLAKTDFGDLKLTIFVIDDGSTDGTARIAREADPSLDLRLFQHVRNLGLGSAVQTGLQAAAIAATDDDAVVIMDADDTHDVALIPELVSALAHPRH